MNDIDEWNYMKKESQSKCCNSNDWRYIVDDKNFRRDIVEAS